VPVEGQWIRVNAPLPARDRRVLAITAVVAVLGVAGAVAAYGGHRSQSNAGCVVVTVPFSMGGVVQRHCGADAKTFCSDPATLATALARCRALGYSRPRASSGG